MTNEQEAEIKQALKDLVHRYIDLGVEFNELAHVFLSLAAGFYQNVSSADFIAQAATLHALARQERDKED